MSEPKCLRCGAGSEWIQGRVPKEDAVTAKLRKERDGFQLGKARCEKQLDATMQELANLRKENARLKELLGRWLTVHPIVLGTNISKDTEEALSPVRPAQPNNKKGN